MRIEDMTVEEIKQHLKEREKEGLEIRTKEMGTGISREMNHNIELHTGSTHGYSGLVEKNSLVLFNDPDRILLGKEQGENEWEKVLPKEKYIEFKWVKR